MPKLDIIGSLQDRGLCHIIEKIFQHLDYFCLRRAELVSPSWEQALHEGKTWKKLLDQTLKNSSKKRLLAALTGLKPSELPVDTTGEERKICCLLQSEAELLDYNWKRFKYGEMYTMIDDPHSPALPSFEMGSSHLHDYNGDWIVMVTLQRDILLIDRWTLEIEEELQFPIMQIRFTGINPRINRVNINENYIVVSLEKHPEICVWDVKTKELFSVIDTEEVSKLPIPIHISNERNLVEQLVLWGDYLLICVHVDAFLPIKSFTLMRLDNSLDCGKVDVVYTNTILPDRRIRSVSNMIMDEKFIVYDLYEETDEHSSLEVRSTFTFELVHDIKILDKNTLRQFDYRNGLIACYSRDRRIRIWDAVTAERLREIRISDEMFAIKLVSDKYFLTCDISGRCKLWDLAAAINSKTSSGANKKTTQQLVVKTFPKLPEAFAMTALVNLMGFFAADEFQIIIGERYDERQFICSHDVNTENRVLDCSNQLYPRALNAQLISLMSLLSEFLRKEKTS